MISDGFEKAFGWVGKIWDKVGGGIDAVINFMTGDNPDKNATGGYITKPTISWIGEAGNEFVIPTENNRGRGKMLLAQAATKLGMRVVDDMGAAAGDGGASSPVSSTASYSASVSPAVGVGNITAEAQAFGREFTGGFDKGIGSNAPSLDQWKQKTSASRLAACRQNRLITENRRSPGSLPGKILPRPERAVFFKQK